MEALRKAGEQLESAIGLPHHEHGHHQPAAGHGAGDAGASATAGSGPPEWASSEHYPGEGTRTAPRFYPDESAEPAKAQAVVGEGHPHHHLDLSKMSPRAQAIVEEVGKELEESPSIIT